MTASDRIHGSVFCVRPHLLLWFSLLSVSSDPHLTYIYNSTSKISWISEFCIACISDILKAAGSVPTSWKLIFGCEKHINNDDNSNDKTSR